METTQMHTTDEWIYSYNGILFNHKKEWGMVTCYNVNEPWQHYTKWKKPGKRYIKIWLYLHECPEMRVSSWECP